MDKRNKKRIEFTVAVDTKDGIRIPRKDYQYVPKESIKFYKGYDEALVNLNTIERLLLDWIIVNMSTKNLIYNSELTRNKFIKHLDKIDTRKKEPYKHDTVRLAFMGLTNKGILRRVRTKIYQVTPVFFFKGSEKERDGMLYSYFTSKEYNLDEIEDGDIRDI